MRLAVATQSTISTTDIRRDRIAIINHRTFQVASDRQRNRARLIKIKPAWVHCTLRRIVGVVFWEYWSTSYERREWWLGKGWEGKAGEIHMRHRRSLYYVTLITHLQVV